MNDRASLDTRARAFFEDLWRRGDPWELETSEFERQRHDHLVATLHGRSYGRVLEIGCGAGAFTRRLATIASDIVAVDVSASAIERARATMPVRRVDFRVANVMDFDVTAEGSWDLVVMTETIYYLGWLYPFFDVAWLASQLYLATARGGRLLLSNTAGGCDDYLLLPPIIRTYRDLFVNVGFTVAGEPTFRGVKDGVALEVLTSLFEKP